MATQDQPDRSEIQSLVEKQQREINQLVIQLTSGYVGVIEEIEIACEPDERRGAEIAKRQILEAVQNAALFFEKRFGG